MSFSQTGIPFNARFLRLPPNWPNDPMFDDFFSNFNPRGSNPFGTPDKEFMRPGTDPGDLLGDVKAINQLHKMGLIDDEDLMKGIGAINDEFNKLLDQEIDNFYNEDLNKPGKDLSKLEQELMKKHGGSELPDKLLKDLNAISGLSEDPDFDPNTDINPPDRVDSKSFFYEEALDDFNNKGPAYRAYLDRKEEARLGQAGKLGDDWIPSWVEGVDANTQFEIQEADKIFDDILKQRGLDWEYELNYLDMTPEQESVYEQAENPDEDAEMIRRQEARKHRTGRMTRGGSRAQAVDFVEGLRSLGSSGGFKLPSLKDVGKGVLKATPAGLASAGAEIGGGMIGRALSPHIFPPLGMGEPSVSYGFLPDWLSWIDPTAGETQAQPNTYQVDRFGKPQPGEAGFDDQMALDLLMRAIPSAFGRQEYQGPEPPIRESVIDVEAAFEELKRMEEKEKLNYEITQLLGI